MAEPSFRIHGWTISGLSGVALQVGGWNDHVHLLIGLKADHRLSDVMRDLKKAATAFVRDEIGLRTFAWQEGYSGFTVGWREIEIVREYILGQEEHHTKNKKPFREELIGFLQENNVEYDPRYLD